MAGTVHAAAPKPIDDLEGWLTAFTRPTVLVELLALAICVALAWAVVAVVRRALGGADARSIWFGRRSVDGVLFPLVLLCLGYVARSFLEKLATVAVFKVVIPVLVALVVIRVGVKVLNVAFAEARWARSLATSPWRGARCCSRRARVHACRLQP